MSAASAGPEVYVVAGLMALAVLAIVAAIAYFWVDSVGWRLALLGGLLYGGYRVLVETDVIGGF